MVYKSEKSTDELSKASREKTQVMYTRAATILEKASRKRDTHQVHKDFLKSTAGSLRKMSAELDEE